MSLPHDNILRHLFLEGLNDRNSVAVHYGLRLFITGQKSWTRKRTVRNHKSIGGQGERSYKNIFSDIPHFCALKNHISRGT